MTREYASGSATEYARQLAAGMDIDQDAIDAAGRASEQVQRDAGIVEPLEIDMRPKRQYTSIQPATYNESVWLDR